MNKMREIRIEKITLNIGAGEAGPKLDRAVKLLQKITNAKPIKTKSHKRIPTWGVRPGLEIGCKVTLRKKKVELLKNLLIAADNKLKPSQFHNGTFSFGVPEYINIPNVNYDPEIGIIGLEVAVTLERPGFRIKRRSIKTKKIPPKHTITKEEAIEFMKKNFGIEIGEQK